MDTDFDTDMRYMRSLAAEILVKVSDTGAWEFASDALAGGTVEYDLMLPDWWPDGDRAADMLAAWIVEMA